MPLCYHTKLDGLYMQHQQCILAAIALSPMYTSLRSSGVAKGGPGRARAQPKHHVRPTHVTWSRAKRFVRAARIQQVPGQYQWPGYATVEKFRVLTSSIIISITWVTVILLQARQCYWILKTHSALTTTTCWYTYILRSDGSITE